MPPQPLILVVDDSADGRRLYAAYLAHHGFRVVEAANGVEAVEQTLSHRPDLILMDLGLPHLDGWEATRRIKADTRLRHIPVLAISGHAFSDSVERARQAGADVFLAKPCPPPVMLAKIRELLARESSA